MSRQSQPVPPAVRGSKRLVSGFPVSEGEAVLHRMLRAEGIDPTAARSLRATWEVFKRFVQIPVITKGRESDGVLYQSGVFAWYGDEEFYLDFVRQFEVLHDDGEHDHFEQLHCEFRFPVTEALRSLGWFSEWWFHDDESSVTWRQFIDIVEARPEFVALRDVPSQAGVIAQEEV
jgi:hypothetical protein